jgi:non-ribosomal peptide synthetase component F
MVAMIDDAHPSFVLTDAELARAWASRPLVPVPVADRAPIYIIYAAKGVVVPHASVVSYIESMRWWVSAEDTVLATASLSFDMHVDDILVPLALGATVAMVSREVAQDGQGLRRALETLPITAMIATPTAWRLLLNAGWAGNPVLKANCRGEGLSADLAAAVRRRVGLFTNAYGPTETCCAATAALVTSDDTPSVGRPLANSIVYVMDEAGQLQVPGIPGEVYIGGAGVTDGYLNGAKLTHERFLVDPLSRGHMVRTGDRGRWRSDGTLEILRLKRDLRPPSNEQPPVVDVGLSSDGPGRRRCGPSPSRSL